MVRNSGWQEMGLKRWVCVKLRRSLYRIHRSLKFVCKTMLLKMEPCMHLQGWTSPVAQMVKNMPAMQETWIQSLGQEDPLVKGMATYSSILTWRIPWTEEPGGLEAMGSHRVRHNWSNLAHTFWDTQETVRRHAEVDEKFVCSVDGKQFKITF